MAPIGIAPPLGTPADKHRRLPQPWEASVDLRRGPNLRGPDLSGPYWT